MSATSNNNNKKTYSVCLRRERERKRERSKSGVQDRGQRFWALSRERCACRPAVSQATLSGPPKQSCITSHTINAETECEGEKFGCHKAKYEVRKKIHPIIKPAVPNEGFLIKLNQYVVCGYDFTQEKDNNLTWCQRDYTNFGQNLKTSGCLKASDFCHKCCERMHRSVWMKDRRVGNRKSEFHSH